MVVVPVENEKQRTVLSVDMQLAILNKHTDVLLSIVLQAKPNTSTFAEGRVGEYATPIDKRIRISFAHLGPNASGVLTSPFSAQCCSSRSAL